MFVILALGALGCLFGRQQAIERPVYGELRLNADMQGREIEMTLLARVPDRAECETDATRHWQKLLEDCPGCSLEAAHCGDELSPRFAGLFDDLPFPATYLNLTAGAAGERDGRVVVYGISDHKDKIVCELLRQVMLKKYRGTAWCVTPSEH